MELSFLTICKALLVQYSPIHTLYTYTLFVVSSLPQVCQPSEGRRKRGEEL